ncbi:competence protein CoiA family protein [Nocardiopsis alba]|uniref:competence protein CoiA n=1 Tax=Nocardiopsis alba TaxID=53437 RepID=UPI0033B201AB
MAFTAIHPEYGRIDATLGNLGCGLDWSQVHRVRPRINLTCPECEWGVHAKHSSRGLRFFAHNAKRPADCQLSNESVEHHLLKLELATAIRQAGWYAELEVRADGGSWRADVLASSLDGTRRMAWEAQLSAITVEELRERTARYLDEGIGVCWVSPRGEVPWLSSVAAVRVTAPKEDSHVWTVADGLAKFMPRLGSWVRVSDIDLTTFVRWALKEQVTPHTILPRYRRVRLKPEGNLSRRSLCWASPKSTAAESRHEQMRSRQDEQKKRRQERERVEQELKLLEEKARKEEEERRRSIEREAEAEKARERLQAQRDQWEADRKERLARAEEQRRIEEERARKAEQARLAQERHEREAATRWWSELSGEQWQDLLAAIGEFSAQERAGKAYPDKQGVDAEYAFGVPVMARRGLYGIARPSPESVKNWNAYYRLRIFVRNQREADLITAQGVDPTLVVHFDLPDFEQLNLC